MNTDEAIALLLAAESCAQCGAPAAPDGGPCGGCGTIPPMTGPELREALEGTPLAVAAVDAARAVAEGQAMLARAIDRIHDADRIRMVAVLRLQRDEAQKALSDHAVVRSRLYGPRTAARKAEETARLDLEKAQAEHAQIARDEEHARRYKSGVKAESAAAILLGEASKALSRYQAAHAEAAARLRAAESAVDQAGGRHGQLEIARDRAVAALADPGRVPYGAESIAAGLVRLMFTGELDDAEKLIAGTFGQWACAMTPVMDGIEATVRQQVKAEAEAEAVSKPLVLPRLADGSPVAAAAPWNTSAPQPYHPPTPGNQPAAYQMPLTSGFPR